MKTYVYTVEGVLSFPLDMLRRDCAWPVSSDDVTKISAACQYPQPDRQLLRVTLRGIRPPTVARWESFGWRVTGPAQEQVF